MLVLEKLLKTLPVLMLLISVAPGAQADDAPRKLAVIPLRASQGERLLSEPVTNEIYRIMVSKSADPGGFVVISKERLDDALNKAELDPIACPGSCLLRAAEPVDADLALGGRLELKGEDIELELNLVATDSGTILSSKTLILRDGEDDPAPLVEVLAGFAQLIGPDEVMPPSTVGLPPKPELAGLTGMEQQEAPTEGTVEVRFESPVEDATVYVDEVAVCWDVPCFERVTPGPHIVRMEAELHQTREEEIDLREGDRIRWSLKPERYSYPGMNGVANAGYMITAGISPSDTGYKFVSVFDGMHFAELNDYADVGFGGGIFTYNETPRGANWGILGFGPTIRFGRLMIMSKVHLLSFRHRGERSEGSSEGWLPGITTRATLPLVNNREWKGWGSLVPALAGGVDVWFDDNLEHDQTGWWLGFSWLGHFDF